MEYKKPSDSTIKWLLGGAAVVGGYFLFKKVNKDNTEKDVLTDNNVQYATQLGQAFNPSGQSWLRGMDGTNNNAVFAVAANIRDFAAVQTAYQNLYNRSLLQDLQNELDSNEYAQFLNIIQTNKNKPVSVTSVPRTTTGTAPTKGTPTLSKATDFKYEVGESIRANKAGAPIYDGFSQSSKILTTVPYRQDLGKIQQRSRLDFYITDGVSRNSINYYKVTLDGKTGYIDERDVEPNSVFGTWF